MADEATKEELPETGQGGAPTPRRAAAAAPVPVEVDISVIRDGARTMIALALERIAAAQEATAEAPDLASLAQALERAVYNSSVRGARMAPRLTHRRVYADTLRSTTQALAAQVGPYPDDVVGFMYIVGRKTADVLVEEAKTTGEVDPRETIRRLFVRTLMQASPVFAQDRERALATARAIEISCFNASVRASKESEEPPRRQWDSPAFVDIYSTRCGTINGLLDPRSTSCAAYGATLVVRLLAAEPIDGLAPLRPEELGDLTEKALCPQATAAERAEIAKRSEQKVDEKESNLFRCPHCHERRCTYREVQRRSLDEAPDYLCLCLNPDCKRRFTGRY